MGLFERPLSEKKGPAARVTSQRLELRSVRKDDIPGLVQLERLCYQQLRRGGDGKFLNKIDRAGKLVGPLLTNPVTENFGIDGFDIEVLPMFCLQQARLETMMGGIGRKLRMQVATRGGKIVGAIGYESHPELDGYVLFSLLMDPQNPTEILERLFGWFESYADGKTSETNLIYDLPDALDTPMQAAFLYLKQTGWIYKLKRDVYPVNVDAWQFKRVFGSNKPRKTKEKAA